jgi:hypothetical protein
MPEVNIKTPDRLRRMESILEELNEGVVIVDPQTSHLFSPRLGAGLGAAKKVRMAPRLM